MARTLDTKRGLDTLGTLNTKMTELGTKLHNAGVSWGDIAEKIGTTRQAASRRFGGGQTMSTTQRVTGAGRGRTTTGRMAGTRTMNTGRTTIGNSRGRTGGGRSGRIRGG